MSWGNYQGQGPRPDPYGRESANEPSGYVTHDPYATYDQGGYDQGGQAYGQQSWGAPNSAYAQNPAYPPNPVPYAGPYQFSYDAMHPPRPRVGFGQAIRLFFKNYANFYGRASRSEYWWVGLAQAILWIIFALGFVLMIAVDPQASEPPVMIWPWLALVTIGGLGLVVPSVSLQVRRLHDAGFSGFFALLNAVPYLNSIAGIALMVMCALPSSPQGVKYDHPNGSQPADS